MSAGRGMRPTTRDVKASVPGSSVGMSSGTSSPDQQRRYGISDSRQTLSQRSRMRDLLIMKAAPMDDND